MLHCVTETDRLLHWCGTQRGGCNQTDVFRDWAATNYHATSMSRTFYRADKHHNDISVTILLQRLGRGWGMSKHNWLVPCLLRWRRHVSATVGHLQVTNIFVYRKIIQSMIIV